MVSNNDLYLKLNQHMLDFYYWYEKYDKYVSENCLKECWHKLKTDVDDLNGWVTILTTFNDVLSPHIIDNVCDSLSSIRATLTLFVCAVNNIDTHFSTFIYKYLFVFYTYKHKFIDIKLYQESIDDFIIESFPI